VERGPLAERAVEIARIHARDCRGVEGADPPLELERTGECLLHRNLLVEDESDEKRKRLFGEQRVGLVVAGEVKAAGRLRRARCHKAMVARARSYAYLSLSDPLHPSDGTNSLLGWQWEEGGVYPISRAAPVGRHPHGTLEQ
jgi:hypothetical protein